MRILSAAALTLLTLARPLAAQIPSPEQHFGFRMGADRQLASADGIGRCFERVASSSDRVRIIDIGPTTEGHRTIAAMPIWFPAQHLGQSLATFRFLFNAIFTAK